MKTPIITAILGLCIGICAEEGIETTDIFLNAEGIPVCRFAEGTRINPEFVGEGLIPIRLFDGIDASLDERLALEACDGDILFDALLANRALIHYRAGFRDGDRNTIYRAGFSAAIIRFLVPNEDIPPATGTAVRMASPPVSAPAEFAGITDADIRRSVVVGDGAVPFYYLEEGFENISGLETRVLSVSVSQDTGTLGKPVAITLFIPEAHPQRRTCSFSVDDERGVLYTARHCLR